MQEMKIGQKSHTFYVEYAITVEKITRNFRKVDKIFRDGLDAVDDPKNNKKILDKYHEFCERMEKRIGLIMPQDVSEEQSDSNNKKKKH